VIGLAVTLTDLYWKHVSCPIDRFPAHHAAACCDPNVLLKTRRDHRSGAIDAASLHKVEDACIEEVVRIR
jgi:hypothetical protein